MKTLTAKRSGALICGALLSTIVSVAEPVNAEPTVMNYTGVWGNGTTGAAYTTWAGTHTYGGAATTLPGNPSPQFTVVLTSPAAPRPGFQYSLDVNFATAALVVNTFLDYTTTLVIKPPGTNAPITNYQVKNGAGTILATTDLGTDGGTIRFRTTIASFNLVGATQDRLIIQWNQAPAPGALALLGLAGLCGTRRRRS